MNQVWQGKRELETTHNVHTTLADYLYLHLHRKFTTPKALSEAAYNLLFNLSKHMYDPDCCIFLKVCAVVEACVLVTELKIYN